MNICRVFMPSGGVGFGLPEEPFKNGLAMKPDIIAADAGSTDSGPAYLANGMCKYSRDQIKADLEMMVKGAKELNIPLFIGSCGTCGTDNMVDEWADITEEILRENGLSGRIAKIYSQQDPSVLQKKWDEGKIHPLEAAPQIDRDTFTECANIVAAMGAEPYIEAFKNGADIVLAGRSTDTAIIASYPVYRGCSEAAAWHGAKTVECGSMCSDNFDNVGIFLTVDEEGFSVTTLTPDAHCTPYTVAAHMLYENADPFRLTEPSGAILTKDATYVQTDEHSTRVTGSGFEHRDQYTMKLEGASVAGYQNISLVGIANKKVLANPQKWMDTLSAYVQKVLDKRGFRREDYSFDLRAYGYNAVITGPVPEDEPDPREIGVLLTVTATTQDLATKIAKVFNPYLLHFPTDLGAGKREIIPTFAFPFSPVDCPRGATYEFRLNHVVDVNDPLELVRFEYIDVGRD